jgi:hypothetical protein
MDTPKLHAGPAHQGREFVVVEGELRNCSCIHFTCAFCPEQGSIHVNHFSSQTEYFSVTCALRGTVFLVHWETQAISPKCGTHAALPAKS